jgi:hypothetical protein
MYSWENSCGDWYKTLESTEGWRKCPKCKEYPRTWVFNNGNYAKCRCYHRFEFSPVFAETVVEACGLRKVPYDEYKNFLMNAWNDHCQKLTELGMNHV